MRELQRQKAEVERVLCHEALEMRRWPERRDPLIALATNDVVCRLAALQPHMLGPYELLHVQGDIIHSSLELIQPFLNPSLSCISVVM